MKKHVHEFWEEGDNKENNKKEERSFEKSNKQIYGCKKKIALWLLWQLEAMMNNRMMMSKSRIIIISIFVYKI